MVEGCSEVFASLRFLLRFDFQFRLRKKFNLPQSSLHIFRIILILQAAHKPAKRPLDFLQPANFPKKKPFHVELSKSFKLLTLSSLLVRRRSPRFPLIQSTLYLEAPQIVLAGLSGSIFCLVPGYDVLPSS